MARPRFDRLPPERRFAILDVAAEVFAAHGFAEASYNQIIAQCGLSKGVFYYYFDDKEDLYLTVVADALSRMGAQLGATTHATTAEELWEQAERLYCGLVGVLVTDARMASLARDFWRSSHPHPRLSDQLQSWLLRTLAHGRSLGAVRTSLADPLAAALILGLLQGADRWLEANPQADPVVLGREVVQAIRAVVTGP